MSEMRAENICKRCGLTYIYECICKKTHANQGIIGKDTDYSKALKRKLYSQRIND